MLQKIRWFIWLLIGTLVLIVAFQNQGSVELDFLTITRQVSLTLLLLATAGISFTLGSLMTLWRTRSRRRAPAVTQKPEKPTPPTTPVA